LCLNAEQRSIVKQKVEDYRKKHQFTIVDFANNGHLSFGCVGAGNGFAHINAQGDLEPCAFFHYSDSNINSMTLTEALASPFFKQYRKARLFTHNPFRPCPIIDVPDILLKLSEKARVHSTHLSHPESMQELAQKTTALADGWKPRAESMYEQMTPKEKKKMNWFSRVILYKDAE